VLDLVYFDEAGFSLDPCVPYAWQPIGETLEIPASKGKRLNVLGFLNTDNDFTPFCIESSVTTDIVIGCFDLFSETIAGKTVVIMDNAPIHTSQAFQEKIPLWEKKGLSLQFLPGYSPELNLIEILWRFIKYRWLPLSAYLNFDALVEAVEEILMNVGSKYKIAFQ
jgi:transposase|tara:strand:- start:85 stop:582 length:498 start_codon:yes stop_codon:yes gene_type:complete